MIDPGYYKWLCDMTELTSDYSLLLTKLANTNFVSLNVMDENREQDGIELRYFYGLQDECNIKRCTILELIIGCAKRVESFMAEANVPDRTGLWCQQMLESLGLMSFTDELYDERTVDNILNNFILRRYSPNGSGGLFTLQNATTDLRNVEIWCQLVWHVNEMLNFKED